MSLCLCDYVYRPASRRSLKSLLTENSLFYADYSSIPLSPPTDRMVVEGAHSVLMKTRAIDTGINVAVCYIVIMLYYKAANFARG